MSDPSLPDVLGASERFWTQIRRERRGDENVGHVADLKECNRSVWFRRNGFEAEPFSAQTARMFQLGHAAEDTEAHAIAEGLRAEGWVLHRGVLYWLGHESIVRTGPAAELIVEQKHENGLIGGKLPEQYYECIGCDHVDRLHDHFTGRCTERGNLSGVACECEGYRPKTALLGDTVLVGHGDYTIRKAWVSAVIDAKSKGYVSAKDAANPRWDYILQTRGYGFAEGAKMFAVLQIDRSNAGMTHQWMLVNDPAQMEVLRALVVDRLLNTRAGVEMPELHNGSPEGRVGAHPPHEWSCKTGKDGGAYCKWTLCARHPNYQAERGLELDA